MKILVVGGGGREHAIITSIAKSSKVTKIYCAPGNAGIAELAECVDIGVMEFDKLVDFAKKEAVDLVKAVEDVTDDSSVRTTLFKAVTTCIIGDNRTIGRRTKVVRPRCRSIRSVYYIFFFGFIKMSVFHTHTLLYIFCFLFILYVL